MSYIDPNISILFIKTPSFSLNTNRIWPLFWNSPIKLLYNNPVSNHSLRLTNSVQTVKLICKSYQTAFKPYYFFDKVTNPCSNHYNCKVKVNKQYSNHILCSFISITHVQTIIKPLSNHNSVTTRVKPIISINVKYELKGGC